MEQEQEYEIDETAQPIRPWIYRDPGIRCLCMQMQAS